MQNSSHLIIDLKRMDEPTKTKQKKNMMFQIKHDRITFNFECLVHIRYLISTFSY